MFQYKTKKIFLYNKICNKDKDEFLWKLNWSSMYSTLSSLNFSADTYMSPLQQKHYPVY